jgi:hypothetical protein
MPRNLAANSAALETLTVPQLKQRYGEVCGEAARSNNKAWLVKRVAWRLQANVLGDLSERARQRARELANDADIRLKPPKTTILTAPSRTSAPTASDDRLPVPGTVLTRKYKGRVHRVTVRADGFEYDGVLHPSLTAIAKAITGGHWNGYLFFGLTSRKEAR